MEQIVNGYDLTHLLSLDDLFTKQQKNFWIEGLLQEIDCTKFHCLTCPAHGAVGGKNDYWQVWPQRSQIAEQLEAPHLGHLYIHESDVIVPLFAFGKSIFSIAARIDLVSSRLQHCGQVVANIAFIIDNENTDLRWLHGCTAFHLNY